MDFELWIKEVIIIMNSELWIMNFIWIMNYEFWIKSITFATYLIYKTNL